MVVHVVHGSCFFAEQELFGNNIPPVNCGESVLERTHNS